MVKTVHNTSKKTINKSIDAAFFLKEQSEAAKQLAASAALLKLFLHEYAIIFGTIIRSTPENLRGDRATAPDSFNLDALQPNAELALLKKNLPQLLWRIYQEESVSQNLLAFLHGKLQLCGFIRNSFHALLLAVVNLKKVRSPGILTRWTTRLTRAANARKLAASPYFDAAWYRRINMDIETPDPALHYLLQGWRDGREPGPSFSGNAYLRANPDVLAARCNPLLHYINHGKAEGRLCFSEGEAAQSHLYWLTFFTPERVLAVSHADSDFRALQKKALTYLGLWRELRTSTSYIVVHPAVGPAHWQRGVAIANYHYLILNNGDVEPGRRPEETGALQEKFSNKSVDIYLEEGYSACHSVSEISGLSPAQRHSLEQLLRDLTTRYPDAQVIPPGNINSRARCPQFDADGWWPAAQRQEENRPTEVTAAPGPLPGWTHADLLKLRIHPPATTAFMALRRRQMPSCCRIRWTWAAWHEISPHIKNAVVFLEDSLFWAHTGLYYMLQARLLRQFLLHRQSAGGSTITQQVVKNLYLSPEKTVRRKLKEALLAIRLERKLNKKRILEIYLNIAEWGPGIFGIAEAAKFYFNCRPAALTALQAAQLAVLLPAPLRYTFSMPYLQDKIWHTTCRLEQGRLPVGMPQEVKREFRDQHYHPLP